LDAIPRLGLVKEPTPLTFAPRFSAAYGGPRLFFKRDDLLPVAFGGNKVRSLDLIAADALRQGADTLLTGAGPLSNHVRAAAGVAALTGLRSVAIYWGTPPARVEGNHLLTRMLGAEIRFTKRCRSFDKLLTRKKARQWKRFPAIPLLLLLRSKREVK
jgi:D-cysteine desulfhydrase